jgi:hypothetical protein
MFSGLFTPPVNLQPYATKIETATIWNEFMKVQDEFSTLKAQQMLGATNDVPTSIALFGTSLASAISSSATSMTLTSASDLAGTTLASSTYAFIIDEGTASQEMVLADCTSTACTNMTRGVSVITGTTTVATLKKSHRRGASVKITDGPQLMILSRIVNGIGTFPNILSYTSHPTFSVGTQIVDKTYVDSGVLAGGATSSESVTGLVRLATALQAASSTPTTVNTPYVMQAQNATDTPQYGCATGYTGTAGAGCSVIADLTGKIKQAWIDLTANFTFTGAINIAASSVKNLTLNSLAYVFPTSQSAGTSLQNDGSGNLSWATISGVPLISTTTTATMLFASTTSFAAYDNLKVVVYVPGATHDNFCMQFNSDATAKYASKQFVNNILRNINSDVTLFQLGFGNATTTDAYIIADINNPSAKRKSIIAQGTASDSGAHAPDYYNGSGVWNNTSAQITQITWSQCGGGFNTPIGTVIKVYGTN